MVLIKSNGEFWSSTNRQHYHLFKKSLVLTWYIWKIAVLVLLIITHWCSPPLSFKIMMLLHMMGFVSGAGWAGNFQHLCHFFFHENSFYPAFDISFPFGFNFHFFVHLDYWFFCVLLFPLIVILLLYPYSTMQCKHCCDVCLLFVPYACKKCSFCNMCPSEHIESSFSSN